MNITEALSALDPDTDEDWTKDGLPAVEAVAELVGGEVTRAMITEAAPNFSRKNPVIEVVNPEPEVPAEPGTDPEASTDEEGGEGGDDGDDEASGDGSDPEEEPEPVPAMGREHPEVLEAAKAMAEAEQEAKAAQTKLKEAQATHAALLEKHAPLVNDAVTNQKGIMDHIASQMKQREERAGLQAVAAAALGQASTKAPIDQVAARKVGHGGERKPPRLMGQANGEDT